MSTSSTNTSTDPSSERSGESKISLEAFRRLAEYRRIGQAGVQAAIEESRRMGVPNVYSINGHTYYELPDGTLSLEDPYPAMQAAKAAQEAKAGDAGESAAQ